MRGSIIEWFHALPVPDEVLNEVTSEPNTTLGAVRPDTGPFGERFGNKYLIRAYLSNKISRSVQAVGQVEAGDIQLDIPTPFVADPSKGIFIPNQGDVAAYNRGEFYYFKRGAVPAADRFVILGRRYTAKAPPVPIIDANKTICWRLLCAKAEE